MATFQLVHPNPHTRGGDAVTRDVDIVPGATLKNYFHTLKLNGLRTTCRVMRMSDHMPLRTSYTPQDGDVIHMRRTSAVGV